MVRTVEQGLILAVRIVQQGLILAVRTVEQGLILALRTVDQGLIMAVRTARTRVDNGSDHRGKGTNSCIADSRTELIMKLRTT